MLLYGLHAHHITIRTLTIATPYSLFSSYRMKTMMPFKVEIPSLRVLMELELEKD